MFGRLCCTAGDAVPFLDGTERLEYFGPDLAAGGRTISRAYGENGFLDLERLPGLLVGSAQSNLNKYRHFNVIVCSLHRHVFIPCRSNGALCLVAADRRTSIRLETYDLMWNLEVVTSGCAFSRVDRVVQGRSFRSVLARFDLSVSTSRNS